MPRGRRSQYVRDASGRFASTPGGGGGLGAARKASSPGSRRKAKPQVTGGSLAARSSLRQSRAKLAANATPQQKGAVTRANKKLTQVQQQSKRKAPAMSGVVRGSLAQRLKKSPPKPVTQPVAKDSTSTKKKIAKTKPSKASLPTKRISKAEQLKARAIAERKARAQKIKEMVNRKGIVKGKNFNDGKDVSTMSMAELRGAVRKKLRSIGVKNKKEFRFMTQQDIPRTRTGWENLHREIIGMPQSDRNRRERPGVINGIDIQKNFRPWKVFDLDPKTASREDIQSAYRRVAKKVHPDLGGRAKDLAKVKVMRDSLLAFFNTPSSKSRKSKSTKKAAKTPAPAPTPTPVPPRPRGPLLLPPARTPDKPKRRGKTKPTAS